MRVTGWGAGLISLMTIGFCAAPEARAELAWFGAQAGYYNEYQKGSLGLHAREDVGGSLTVGLTGDYIFRPHRSTWVLAADLQYDLPLGWRRVSVWGGVGGGVLCDDVSGPKEPDPNFEPIVYSFAGVGLKRGRLLPYTELRLMSHGPTRVVAYVGLRF